MQARLRFLGAAQNVTGSRHMLEIDGTRLLVDCGLYQERQFASRNWDPFVVPPASIQAVLLTHAHLDHCGYLPALWKQGFRGAVFATAGTRALAEIVLMDSARIQEDDASYANRKGFSKHHPALPLYTVDDARSVLECFRGLPWREVGLRVFPRGGAKDRFC